MKSIEKWTYIKQQFPDNPVVARISARRTLEIGDVTPEELKEIEEFEKKKAEMMMQPQQPQQPQTAIPSPENQMIQGITEKVNQLAI